MKYIILLALFIGLNAYSQVCYPIIDGQLGKPLTLPDTYDHKRITGLLNQYQYVCYPNEIDPPKLYKQPKERVKYDPFVYRTRP